MAPFLPRAAEGSLDLGDTSLIEFSESVYSDFILTCARGRPWAICTSALVLLFCFGIQGMFAIMISSIAVDQVSPRVDMDSPGGGAFNIYEAWRMEQDNETYAGSLYSERGLACQGDMWSWESESAANMADYASVTWLSAHIMSNGELFGLVSLTLWIGYVFQEFRDIVSFMCLLSMRSTPRGHPDYVFDSSSGTGRLQGLSGLVRAAIVLTAAARITLTATLGYYGILFLSFTGVLGDFILNCVALLFVNDIDELCFNLFLPGEKRQAIMTLQPTAVSGRRIDWMLRLSPVTEPIVLVLILGTVAAFQGNLAEFSENYIFGAYAQACTGYIA